MTQPTTIKIDNVEYVRADSVAPKRSETTKDIDRSKPRVIRHHKSGVWLCYVLGEGSIPGRILIFGRRVWSWSSNSKIGRLETSQIATRGLSKDDKLGDPVTCELVVSDDMIDVIASTEAVVEAGMTLPSTEV